MRYAVDLRQKIPLCGFPQMVHIRAARPGAPVLLFLHGGPGIIDRHLVMENHADLCEDYTVVCWDQRGTGGSFAKVDMVTLNRDQLLSDACALVDFLCETLGQEKLYLVCRGWGTQLGSLLCRERPERIAGYLGMGQLVDMARNEELSYAATLEKAMLAHDERAINMLMRIGPPVNGRYRPAYEGLMEQRKIMSRLGGANAKHEDLRGNTVAPILSSRELSLADKAGVLRGYKLCLRTMLPTVTPFSLLEACPAFAMPYYIFQGRLDETAHAALVSECFDAIVAPEKELLWFERTAHSPLDEEPARFKALLRARFPGKTE